VKILHPHLPDTTMALHRTLPFLLAMLLGASAIAAEVPAASAEFRARYVEEYAPACIKGIEDNPEMRALYSHATVATYCTCRQRYRADMVAQAIATGRRGKAVDDEGYEYAAAKCARILTGHLEKE
jgi:hypothetical protein